MMLARRGPAFAGSCAAQTALEAPRILQLGMDGTQHLGIGQFAKAGFVDV
jgi:hypothetical protein